MKSTYLYIFIALLFLFSFVVFVMGISSLVFFKKGILTGSQGVNGKPGQCLSDDIKNNQTYEIERLHHFSNTVIDNNAYVNYYEIDFTENNNNKIFNIDIENLVRFIGVVILINKLKNNETYEIFINAMDDSFNNNKFYNLSVDLGIYCSNYKDQNIDDTTLKNCQTSNTPLMMFTDGQYTQSYVYPANQKPLNKSTFYLKFVILNKDIINCEYKLFD